MIIHSTRCRWCSYGVTVLCNCFSDQAAVSSEKKNGLQNAVFLENLTVTKLNETIQSWDLTWTSVKRYHLIAGVLRTVRTHPSYLRTHCPTERNQTYTRTHIQISQTQSNLFLNVIISVLNFKQLKISFNNFNGTR